MSYEPERLESDDERLTSRYERMAETREYDDYDEDDDDCFYCEDCGRSLYYDFEQGGRVCPKHGLQ